MAEREGFEPPIEFPLYTLSRRAPSTTRPSLRATDRRVVAARPSTNCSYNRTVPREQHRILMIANLLRSALAEEAMHHFHRAAREHSVNDFHAVVQRGSI